MALKDIADKVKSKVKAGVDYLTDPNYSEDQKKLNDLSRQVDTANKASIDAGSGKNNPEEWEKTRALRNELWDDYNKQFKKTYHRADAFVDELKQGKKMKRGGAVKAKPKTSSASKRADGCATKGKTKGRII